ncbi:MAG: tRNA (adenosine(37)-N6)-dimethylallyltransferase MiaA [Sporomusaceae bacterium]|nr:tRNA (adenosine(37)-N6)-dimethylallyltransferase MiaA [Sporomusaceae bacterium]
MEKVIAIVGPTAVGKTKVSLDLARYLDTEIISGDSMLVYRGLDIGTAKPSLAERGGIVHELIDIRDPGEEFSVADFKQLAAAAISRINAAGKIAVIAGGTGLYLRALLEDYDLTSPPADEALRSRLQQLAAEQGNHKLHELLAAYDPRRAAALHPNDVRRIIRALEIVLLTNTPTEERRAPGLVYDSLVIGLTMPRDQLYERINRRVDSMLAQGLTEEVARLLAAGVPQDCQAMQAIGYKQMLGLAAGDCGLDEAVQAVKQATRNFAKRQMTWYRKMPYVQWLDTTDYQDHNQLMEQIYNLVAEKFCIE